MIDLHTHILPKMDDGSQSVEETAKLLEILKQNIRLWSCCQGYVCDPVKRLLKFYN